MDRTGVDTFVVWRRFGVLVCPHAGGVRLCEHLRW